MKLLAVLDILSSVLTIGLGAGTAYYPYYLGFEDWNAAPIAMIGAVLLPLGAIGIAVAQGFWAAKGWAQRAAPILTGLLLVAAAAAGALFFNMILFISDWEGFVLLFLVSGMTFLLQIVAMIVYFMSRRKIKTFFTKPTGLSP
jgi:hypothetical protein